MRMSRQKTSSYSDIKNCFLGRKKILPPEETKKDTLCVLAHNCAATTIAKTVGLCYYNLLHTSLNGSKGVFYLR